MRTVTAATLMASALVALRARVRAALVSTLLPLTLPAAALLELAAALRRVASLRRPLVILRAPVALIAAVLPIRSLRVSLCHVLPRAVEFEGKPV